MLVRVPVRERIRSCTGMVRARYALHVLPPPFRPMTVAASEKTPERVTVLKVNVFLFPRCERAMRGPVGDRLDRILDRVW